MADNESNVEKIIHRVATHPNKAWASFYQLTRYGPYDRRPM